jgi:hypothetical protein
MLLPVWRLPLRSAALLPGADGVPAAAGCGLWLGAAGWMPGLAAGRLRPPDCLLLAAAEIALYMEFPNQ